MNKAVCLIGAPVVTVFEFVLFVMVVAVAMGLFDLEDKIPRLPLWIPVGCLTVSFIFLWIPLGVRNYRRCRSFWRPRWAR